METEEHIEWLREKHSQYIKLVESLKTEHIAALQTEFDQLHKENENLIKKYNDLKFFIQSVADGDYKNYQEAAQRLLKSHGEI